MDELRAFLFGITVAIAIGPIAVLILNVGINKGFVLAMRCAAGAATADFLYSLVALGVGSALVSLLHRHAISFRLFASLVLLGLGIWMTYRSVIASGKTVAADSHGHFGFFTVLFLTLINPLTILIFVGFSGQLEFSGGFVDIVRLSLLIFIGSLLVQTSIAAGGAAMGRILQDPKLIRHLNIASGALIAGFGSYGIIRLL